MSNEIDKYEEDRQWLITHGHTYIDLDKFHCRVNRFVGGDGWPEESARKEVVKLFDQEAAIELGIV